MTTKIKTTLLTAFFFFGLLTGLQAQDKYEYAIITYVSNEQDLSVSYDDKAFQKIDIPKDSKNNWRDFSPALKQLAKMTSEGWEVFNTGTIGGSAIALNGQLFYLRKKKS